MANLISKKLSQLLIGTHIELTYENSTSQHECVSGTITDNDFSGNLEITTENGSDLILNYELVRGILKTVQLPAILAKLPSKTRILFSYNNSCNEELLRGTIVDNDCESTVEIQTDSGEDLLLNYNVFQSLLLEKPCAASASVKEIPSKPAVPVKKADRELPLHMQLPEDSLNLSDIDLKKLFSQLLKEEQRLLGASYESFKYGIRISSKEKISNAAANASQVLLHEANDGFLWTSPAVRFCGALLRRAGTQNSEVFLCGDCCFYEAAFAFWREQSYSLSGAYAVLALLDGDDTHAHDLSVILSSAIIQSNDISGLKFLSEELSGSRKMIVHEIVDDLLAEKGVHLSPPQDHNAALSMLYTLYGTGEMIDEIKYWYCPEPQENLPETKPEKTGPQTVTGQITKLIWSEHTGVITGADEKIYQFRYTDITDAKLLKEVQNCMRMDLGGKVFPVKFTVENDVLRDIRPDIPKVESLVNDARTLVIDASREDRFETAFEMCRNTFEKGLDIKRAIVDMVKYSIAIYNASHETKYAKAAIAAYESSRSSYIETTATLMDLASCYHIVKNYPQMIEQAQKALSDLTLSIKQLFSLLPAYLRMLKENYDATEDRALLNEITERVEAFRSEHIDELFRDPTALATYNNAILPYRVIAECELDRLEEAETDATHISSNCTHRQMVDEYLKNARARCKKEDPAPLALEAETAPAEDESDVINEASEADICESVSEINYEECAAAEPCCEVQPYTDSEGFKALGLTKQAVIDYALQIDGDDRIASILAYLRAGANLNDEILPVYQAIALAANDPMDTPDYGISALTEALANNDSDYPELNDCCMAAAFLRSSFLSGVGYDYSAKGFRDSIMISRELPSLRNCYDLLEAFRKTTNCAIDIYADYRNLGAKLLDDEMNATVQHANELYTKFIATPAREGVKFARLLETKKIVFSKDGYFAMMLQNIISRNQKALDDEKTNFVEMYLGGSPNYSAKRISDSAIDSLIEDCWLQAGKELRQKKNSATLQGDRRNNLRSNISEIIGTIFRWYDLCEQNSSLTWRTPEGNDAYCQYRPRILNELEQLATECNTLTHEDDDPQRRTGLFLLAFTAGELSARLDGSWKRQQQRYLYADFLKSNNVLLDKNFLPDLSATFCALPDFNILSRIRSHVEGRKASWQEQIDRIYGQDKNCSNYGTAELISEYLAFFEKSDSVIFPDSAALFSTYSEKQADLRYHSFCETYALAMNYGQIIKSDTFCCTLEDTAKYWYLRCKETKNFGFFVCFLQHAERQIPASASQYAQQLNDQLDALIAGNPDSFADHPNYAEAIRDQIENKNFTVAEDWMARIRIGDFSLEVNLPEALETLNSFWTSYVSIYKRVADASRSLISQLGKSETVTPSQELIDNWLVPGKPMNSERVRQLLNRLGWRNINVRQYQFAGATRAEIYEITRESGAVWLTAPQHSIAAFGSDLYLKKDHKMYVACLYGAHDCDQVYEKIRTLDEIGGNMMILLDHALGQIDRRALARKMKQRDSGLRNVFLVVDRVLITYLANNYNEKAINKSLVATALPFSYCQPYVVESVHTMPPEIFIGRKDELLTIERPDGVNLIYGGRQLGKSALFKKAVTDIDRRQQQRAVLIDIASLDCAAAAMKVSRRLIDEGITPDAEVTDNWDILCRNIELCLRKDSSDISYFLLMLDEADAFISDCSSCNYRPLGALKDVQQTLPGRFKYVLAGLHNIVKFNRQVSLGNNSVITHMSHLKITPFHTPEAEELLTVPLSYLGFSLPSKVTVSQILATCNYFPGLIQLYAKKLIESLRTSDYAGYDDKKTPPYIVSDAHLRRVMSDRDFVDQIHEKFEITLTLDEDQGSRYYPIALLIGWMYSFSPSESGYTADDVLRIAKDLSVTAIASLDPEEVNELLCELQDLNILRSVSDNSYLLASKNFRDLLGSDEEIFEKLEKLGRSQQ